MRIQKGVEEQGVHPLENHKAIGFLINTGLDPMENHEASKTAFNGGPRRPDFSGIQILSPLINYKIKSHVRSARPRGYKTFFHAQHN